ncbi:hypothetical protein QFZ66_002400 [Streptomyces sp. B4I13]|nr:hypothetical protein [Streptomyces sp. B4I13]
MGLLELFTVTVLGTLLLKVTVRIKVRVYISGRRSGGNGGPCVIW